MIHHNAICVAGQLFDLKVRLQVGTPQALISIEIEGHEPMSCKMDGTEWQEKSLIRNISIDKGKVRIIIRILHGQVDLDWLEFI
ncbi:hypothetical protein [Paenibacillus crassostreae]|uniref:hypothetical protein n=1 Tax=Paenibacillus crassostreae TaxID=1763538 RepID=UPI000A57666F|nr:hypothetical protein [Paenibacillus crassostreae]